MRWTLNLLSASITIFLGIPLGMKNCPKTSFAKILVSLTELMNAIDAKDVSVQRDVMIPWSLENLDPFVEAVVTPGNHRLIDIISNGSSMSNAPIICCSLWLALLVMRQCAQPNVASRISEYIHGHQYLVAMRQYVLWKPTCPARGVAWCAAMMVGRSACGVTLCLSWRIPVALGSSSLYRMPFSSSSRFL